MRKVFLTKVLLSYTIRHSVRCTQWEREKKTTSEQEFVQRRMHFGSFLFWCSPFFRWFFWHTLVKTFSLHVLAVFLLPSLLPSRWCLKCLCTLNSLFVEFDSLFSNSSRSMHAQLTKLFGIPMSAHTLTIEKLLNENNLWFVSSLTVAPFVGIFLFSAYKLYRFPQASFNWAMK